jgi:chromosome partitioning protein
MAYVISIANVKGGVGKTTIVHNVSHALAISGKKVLMIDLDLQENLTDRSVIEKENILYTSYDLFSTDVVPYKCVYPTSIENVDIIPSRVDIADVRRSLNKYSNNDQLKILKNRLADLDDKYDFIFLDLHPSLDFVFASAMAASQYYIIPVLPNLDSIKGVNLTTRFSNDIKKIIPSLKELGIVISNYDTRTKVSEHIADKLAEVLQDRLFNVKIARSAGVLKAAAQYQTTFQYDNKLRCNKEYLDLAKEIIKRIK